jgi:hypothetical protein
MANPGDAALAGTEGQQHAAASLARSSTNSGIADVSMAAKRTQDFVSLKKPGHLTPIQGLIPPAIYTMPASPRKRSRAPSAVAPGSFHISKISTTESPYRIGGHAASQCKQQRLRTILEAFFIVASSVKMKK